MKKTVALILCAVMLFGTLTVGAAALRGNETEPVMVYGKDYTLGDCNRDGEINSKDDYALKLHNAGIGEINTQAADVICDGKINAKDLLAVKKHLAGGLEDDISKYELQQTVGCFTIAGNDISQYSIVYDPQSKYIDNIYYAADTLRKYVALATGVELPMVEGSAEGKVIEFVDVSKDAALEEKLGVENYIYEVREGNLMIYGTRRGSLYTVYELLEDYLGYNFCSDNFTYGEILRNTDIPEGTYVFYKPAVVLRDVSQAFSGGSDSKELHFHPRRLNSMKSGLDNSYLGTLTGPHFIHSGSVPYYWQMATGWVDVTCNADYSKKYADGESVDYIAWKYCFTDEDQYEVMFRGLLETMRWISDWHVFRKDTSYMSVATLGYTEGNVCACRSCRYIFDDGSYTKRVTGEVVERLDCGIEGLNLYLANKAARDITAYYDGRAASEECDGSESAYGEALYDEYPDMKIYTFFYTLSVPPENLLTDERYADIVPEENIMVMVDGYPCHNHYMGSGECQSRLNVFGESGAEGEAALKRWGDILYSQGAEFGFEYHPSNYNTVLTDSPNVFNIWYDFVYLVEECHVTGFYYKGVYYGQVEGYEGYGFETLKSHLAAELMWSMNYDEDGKLCYMSFEEYCRVAKEYMKIYYGEGYNELFEYIRMQEEAGDQSDICFVNGCDYPGDMFDYEYIRDNYEEMRALLEAAYEKAETDEQRERIEWLGIGCDLMGLSAVKRSYCDNGTAETKALYEERFTCLYNYVIDNNMQVFSKEQFVIEEHPLDLTKTPLEVFYGGGTWRIELDDQWSWLGSTPSK